MTNQKRSDAQVHRTLLLDAADHVFSEHGVHVALEFVTEKAGVSRATLYRNFPDREALMKALLERAFEQLEVKARATDRNSPVLSDAQTRLARMVKPLLEQAVSAGVCRADLTAKDVVLVTSMFGACLRGRTPAERRKLSKRALRLLLEGLFAAPTPKIIRA